jgi:hypothetical protein
MDNFIEIFSKFWNKYNLEDKRKTIKYDEYISNFVRNCELNLLLSDSIFRFCQLNNIKNLSPELLQNIVCLVSECVRDFDKK